MPIPILVTGAAGFIGFHVARALLNAGKDVAGADNLNAYYDPALKRARLRQIEDYPSFIFYRVDLADREATAALFAAVRPSSVIHLAAQAGVRHSLTDPHATIESNISALLNVLEGCRHHGVEHLVYASSSSVYGDNMLLPSCEHERADRPLSLYAATKRANELMAHSYSHLFGLPTTGLRFFTVYGPWGRPDMALFTFTKAVLEGRPIKVFNNGNMQRDFTYIDDIVEGVIRVADRPDGVSLYNIGNGEPVNLMDVVSLLERETGRKAIIECLPMQAGDPQVTWADISNLARDFDYRPKTSIEAGVHRFVAWYREHYSEQMAA